MKKVKLFEEFVEESTLSSIHKAAKKGDYPVTVVAIENGKVVHQELVNTPMAVPAAVRVTQGSYPKAKIHVEDRGGMVLFTEGAEVNERVSSSEEKAVRSFFEKNLGKNVKVTTWEFDGKGETIGTLTKYETTHPRFQDSYMVDYMMVDINDILDADTTLKGKPTDKSIHWDQRYGSEWKIERA